VLGKSSIQLSSLPMEEEDSPEKQHYKSIMYHLKEDTETFRNHNFDLFSRLKHRIDNIETSETKGLPYKKLNLLAMQLEYDFSREIMSAKDNVRNEKIMLEKNIPNHETAAEYWKWMQQSAAPTPGTSYNPSTLSKFDLSKFQKNPVAAARDEAFKALNELRKSPKPIGL
jgi:hypothetical protein